jgi:hypothetical protein
VKKILFLFFVFGVTAASAAKYEGLVSEAQMGLDHVAVQHQGYAPDGSLGRAVYTEKVETDLDIYIPTDNYLRLGAAMNLGAASSTLKIEGKDKSYNFGISEQFGFGWNLSSFIRSEIGWMHNNMQFGDSDADMDVVNGTIYFDLRRRHILQGDVTYRRKIVPFIGLGAGTGYASFSQGKTYAGSNAFLWSGYGAAGVSFVFSDITALDLMIRHEYFTSAHRLGWDGEVKQFRNTGISLSLRAGF